MVGDTGEAIGGVGLALTVPLPFTGVPLVPCVTGVGAAVVPFEAARGLLPLKGGMVWMNMLTASFLLVLPSADEVVFAVGAALGGATEVGGCVALVVIVLAAAAATAAALRAACSLAFEPATATPRDAVAGVDAPIARA